MSRMARSCCLVFDFSRHVCAIVSPIRSWSRVTDEPKAKPFSASETAWRLEEKLQV